MAITYTINSRKRRVESAFRGVITDPDLLGYAQSLRHDPRFHPQMSELMDLTQITEANVTSEMIAMRGRSTAYAASSCRAIVAPSPLLFGMARMFQLSLSEENAANLGVYHSLAEALKWLDSLCPDVDDDEIASHGGGERTVSLPLPPS